MAKERKKTSGLNKMSMDDLAGRKALFKASMLKAGHILDIGMGDCGCMSFFLAKKGFNVIGIDRSTKAVGQSRKNAKKKKFVGAFEAKLANAEKLPFPDNEFDAIVAYHSLHHANNAEKVIDEMFRVCKNNGLILVADLNEKGRKAYKHKDDGDKLLKALEETLLRHTNSMQKLNSKYNTMFVCKK